MPKKTQRVGAPSGADLRRHARTQESFPLRFLPISEEEFASLRELYATRRTRDRDEGPETREGFIAERETGLDPLLLRMFERIERKLDQILEIQLKGKDHRKSSGWENAACVDISGGGVRFTARWPASVGTYLKLVLPLPRIHPVTVVAAGRVVRAVKMSDAAEGAFWDMACQFDAIHEDDREEIIGYNFERHRQLIRSQAAMAD
ncbi:MAG: PilZ domain-containing protein [Nitrospinota bacterium]